MKTMKHILKSPILQTLIFPKEFDEQFYAQTLIPVNLIVVISFGFLVITRHHGDL